MTKLYSEAFKKPLMWVLSGTAVLLGALMVIGTFWDLEIAQAVAVSPHGFLYYAFGVGFEFLGFWPAILVDAGLFLALSIFAKKKVFKIAFIVLASMFMIGGVFGSVFFTLSNHGHSMSRAISGTISFFAGSGLTFGFWWLLNKSDRVTLKRLTYILAIGAIMAFFTNLTAFLMQVFWGRYRFYVVEGYGAPFTQWFRPFGRGGTAEDFFGSNSFPSIHAASVASIAMLLPIAWALKAKKSTRIIFAVITIVMLICVPLSRMVLSWHYLTDVVFSLIVGLVFFVISLLVIDKLFGERFKKFLSDTEPEKEKEKNGVGV